MDPSRRKHTKLARQNFKLLYSGLKSERLGDTEHQAETAKRAHLGHMNVSALQERPIPVLRLSAFPFLALTLQ